MATSQLIDAPHLKLLVEAGAVQYLTARGIPGGFVIVVRVGLNEKTVRGQKVKAPRVFTTLDGISNYCRAAGVRRFDVDLAGYSKESLL
jgi:hypothetical protein